MDKEKSAQQKLEEQLKDFWRKSGKASVVAAKHTEFVIEPKVIMGNQLHPEILQLLVENYLKKASLQDSGIGNIEATPDQLTIKTPKGKPLIVVNDKKIINKYLATKK